MNGALTTSLADLLQFMSEEQVRALAAARTGISSMAQLGVLQQLSSKWQIGGDVRVSRYETLNASGLGYEDPNVPEGVSPTLTGLIAETPSSGEEWALSPQLIGSNLFSSSDITVFSLSFMSSPLYKGQSFYIYNRRNVTDKWSLDLSLQYYKQNYESGMLMTRIVPSFRTAYQIRQSLSLDMDAGMEMSHTETEIQTSDGRRQFFSLGFRYDF